MALGGPNASGIVMPEWQGDYNQNGTVDAVDYTIWRDNLGSATALPNDDTPGVAADDYDRWKINFGATAGSGSSAPAATGDSGSAGGNVASIPEPASLFLLLLTSLPLIPLARRDRAPSAA